MEQVLWDNAGKPTAFRDVHGVDYETAQKYMKMHGINYRDIAFFFNVRGEQFTEEFVIELRKIYKEQGQVKALEAAGVGWTRFRDVQVEYGHIPYNHEILKVEILNQSVDVYDLEIEETHNFIAAELCVHNSASGPNLQNIPADQAYRNIFEAPPGFVIIKTDASQQEVRVLAEVSGDPALQHIYVSAGNKAVDIYRETASSVLSKSLELITDLERTVFKVIVLALGYGASPNTIASSAGILVKAAKDAITLQAAAAAKGVRTG